jgi:hypothetical protein
MKLHISTIGFSIPLTKIQWERLNCLDFLNDINKPFVNLGASKIEYNGHFGRYFFFTTQNQTEGNKILNELKKQLNSKKAKSGIKTGDCYR